ncbi:MAG: hypothetical protein ACK464_00200, partial [Bacteroidota bacterium]
MKRCCIIGLFLFLGILPKLMRAQSNGLNKYVNIQYHGSQFTAVLDLFTQQTGFNFAYNNQLLPLPKLHDIHYQNLRADKALRDFLQQNGLDFQVSNTT